MFVHNMQKIKHVRRQNKHKCKNFAKIKYNAKYKLQERNNVIDSVLWNPFLFDPLVPYALHMPS
jgi:hypothetical protein